MSYQASFKKELNRLYTIRWIAQNELGNEHISWKSKLDIRNTIKDLEVNLPEIYQTARTVDGLKEPTQDSWVLKPAKGAANRGVYPIIKKQGKWFNLFERKYMDWNQIKNACKRADGTKPPYIIEEFVGNESLPYNWELYCFNGQIGLVRQRENTDRKGKLYKFWDIYFNDLGLIEESKKDILKAELPQPNHPKELLETAKLISENIPYAFCRIDLYDTDKVYFGELTFHPGIGNNFNQEIDNKLGKMWLRAEAGK